MQRATRPSLLLRTASEHGAHAISNHALQGMNGLVMGVTVRGEKRIATEYSHRRRIRLLIRSDETPTSAVPNYGFALDENGREVAVDSSVSAGPTIIVESQPVGIMVVNKSDEPTAIHWHGIELESYFDGVAGFSGIEKRLTPVIAPRDSFEARFTPPRAGTFMYHTHVDEGRQQRGGLSGMAIAMYRDTVLSRWTRIATDGADLPIVQRVMTPSRYGITIGRTVDFEMTPSEPGEMRIEMLTSGGRLLGKIPIHVR